MIFEEPATYLLLGILCLILYSGKGTRLSTVGFICYGLTLAAYNAYRLVPYDIAVITWQVGLFFTLILYGVVSRHMEAPIVGASILLPLYILDIISRYTMEAIAAAAVAVTSFVILLRTVPRWDKYGQAVWAIVAVSVTWGAIEVPVCRVLLDVDLSTIRETWGVTVDKSTCGNVFGNMEVYSIWFTTAAALLWMTVRWKQAQTRIK